MAIDDAVGWPWILRPRGLPEPEQQGATNPRSDRWSRPAVLTANLTTVAVVPNPLPREREVWDQIGGHEVHFINLPTAAKIRIYTVALEVWWRSCITPIRCATSRALGSLKNGRGQDVSSGIYIYRVEAVNFFRRDRFIVIR